MMAIGFCYLAIVSIVVYVCSSVDSGSDRPYPSKGR